MRNRYIWAVFVLTAILPSMPAASQTSSLDEPGIPSFTTAFPVEHGFINLANGNLHIEIPIGSYSQRGNIKALHARLVYDSRFWKVRTDPVTEGQSWSPGGIAPIGITIGGGFRLITDLEPGFANETFSSSQCGCILVTQGGQCQPKFKTTYSGFFYQEPNGTKHSAQRLFKLVQKDPSCTGPPSDSPNTTVLAADNSGYLMVINNYAISAVYAPDGTQVFPTVQDTNGNYFSQDGNRNVIDTLGRTPLVVTQSGNQTFLDYLCTPGTVGCDPTNGNRARVTLNTAAPNWTTQFNQTQGELVGEYSGPGSALTSISLPDGSSYQFQQDSYGMITSMTLPTGGQILYGYTNIADYGGNINRWVTSRIVDGKTWSFTPAQLPCSTTPCPMQVTVTTPSYSDGVTTSSDDRVYTFQVITSGAWNSQIQYFRGPASGNPLVTKTIDYGIVGPTGNIVPGFLGSVMPVPIRETLTWPMASGTLSKKIEYGYDGYTNVTAVKQWDYQPGGNFASTPDREIDNIFKTDSAYLNANMLRLKSSTTVKNSAGTQLAQTTYGYDENPLKSSGVATHLNTPSGPRGNLTSSNRWLVPNNVFLTTGAKWFDTGEVYQFTDPLGNATTFAYDAAFAGGYPTQVCNALSQCSYTGYDFNTGLSTSFTDANGSSAGDQAHTTTHTYDSLLRPLCTTTPDGGQTCLSYPNVTTVQKTTKITATINDVSSKIVNGLGRLIQTQHTMAGGTAKSDTTYDPLGRVSTVSNPYFSASDPTYGVTQYQYEGLGRVAQTIKQDGSATRLSYSANCTTATDETGKPRKTCTNGFGELIEVDEPNAASTGTSATASVTINGSLLTANSVVDSGTVSLASGGFVATACFGNSTNSSCVNQPVNNTAAQVAAALATKFNILGSPITATTSSGTLSLIWNTPGPFYPSVAALSTTHDQPSLFTSPSFTSQPTMFDHGVGPSFDTNPYVTLYQYDVLGNLICVEQHGGVTGTGCSGDSSLDNSSPWRVRRFTYDSLSRLLTAKNPESGTITYFYDNNGNLTQKVMPSPNQTGTAQQTISYCYDLLNRVTGKAYSWQNCQNGQLPSGTAAVTYTYDERTNGIGHLTSLTDQAGSATYNYDILGRMSSESRIINGITKNMGYAYNLDDSVATVTYPSATPNGPPGDVITYTPDTAGHILSVKDIGNSINYVTGATYNAPGMLTGSTYGQSASFTGIVNQFSFNTRLQPANLWSASPTKTLMDLIYDFQAWIGDNGNVTRIINNRDQSRNQYFTYDSLNRLTSAQNFGTDCNVTILGNKTKFWGNSYAYDAWGNLMQKQVTKCQAENLNSAVNQSNRLQSFDYDSAGNMTKDNNGTSYVFDPENRISSTSGFTYIYDADGNRVKKSNGTTGTLYWYTTVGIVGESDLLGNLQSEYIFFGGERVARKDLAGNAVSYYFSDHLKTASVITDSSGTITAESDYYPWGGELQIINNDSNHYRFTGKERDAESGLDYFGARHYSNGLGRFITPDWSQVVVPIPYADLADPQSLNQYSYVRNIPTSRTDPDGHCTRDGEQHGFFWCLGHAFGITQTQQEFHNSVIPERQWLLNNVATNGAQRGILGRLSDTQIHTLYRQWDSALMHAQCDGFWGCETWYPASYFHRAANGALVLYRGGDFSNVKPNEYKLDSDGNVRAVGDPAARGPSVNADPANIPPRFAENINEVKLFPPELTVKPWGKAGHFEVVPREPVSPARFLELLKEVGLELLKDPKIE